MRRALGYRGDHRDRRRLGGVSSPGSASADPSADDWYQLRMCESTNRYDINTGNGYYGAYQFDLRPGSRSVAPVDPTRRSPAEQDYRALDPLPRSRLGTLGLRSAGRAERGFRRQDRGRPAGRRQPEFGGSGPSEGREFGCRHRGAPAYPGRQFREGDSSEDLKAWQKQMGTRGYDLVGTGYFGPKTKAAVLDLQAKAGIERRRIHRAEDLGGGLEWLELRHRPLRRRPRRRPTCRRRTNPAGSVNPLRRPGRASSSSQGDTDRDLQCFQRQLGSRGYGLTGTGYYGPATKAAVVALQQRERDQPVRHSRALDLGRGMGGQLTPIRPRSSE